MRGQERINGPSEWITGKMEEERQYLNAQDRGTLSVIRMAQRKDGGV